MATLFRMAQADLVSSQERDRLQPVADWMGAVPEELEQSVRVAYDTTQGLRDLLSSMQGDKGLLLFREACAIAWVDGVKSPEEAEFLDLLALVLGLSDSTRQILDSPLACSPEGERRFLEHLGG